MFAIMETGGKQYKVAAGDVLTVEKLPAAKEGSHIVFDKILLVNSGKETKIGTPYIKGSTVTADLVAEGKGKKIVVIRYKAKSRYKKTKGHRQPFTKIKISKIA